MVKNIWKSYIWTADKDVNESDPRNDVHYLGSSENKAWKKFSCTRNPGILGTEKNISIISHSGLIDSVMIVFT